MEKVLKVEGMMCPHCEEHVKKALEEIPEVVSAVADHKEKKVTVTLNATVEESVLKTAVEKAGYTVI